MRISDWSSDVCSSDLHRRLGDQHRRFALHHRASRGAEHQSAMLGRLERLARDERADERLDQPRLLARDDAEDRELVVPAADNALIAPPRQYRLDMSGAKALPGAIERADTLMQIGRAAGGERGCQYVEILEVAG